MLQLLKEINKKQNFNSDDVERLHKKFLSEIKILKNISWIEWASIDVTLISKISYYETLFNLAKMNCSTLSLLITELINDFDWIKKMQEKSNKNSDKLEKIKKSPNFFIDWDEIIFSTKSEKFWLFVTYLKWSQLRTINLTSNANWYHLFWDWRFCSWNTYSTLQNLLLEKQDLFLFIVFLKKILTDYDDNRHHLAKPADFKPWLEYNKTKSNKATINELFKKKKKIMLDFAKKDLSKKGYEFILKTINNLKEKHL